MSPTVDEFVQTRISPEQHEIVATVRALIREYAPETTELVSYDMPVFVKKHIFAYITASKTHITLGFVRGNQINDTYGLLKGKAKHARHLKIRRAADVNRDALRDYVSQALVLDGS